MSIEAMNQALSWKWLWRADMEGSTMWKDIVVSKYLGGWNGWCFEGMLGSQVSSLWKNILKLKDFYICSSSISVWDGRKAKFWEEPWLFNIELKVVFPSLHAIALKTELKQIQAQDGQYSLEEI